MFDDLRGRYPTTLTACGEAVGLPKGQMGNSEVGHLNLGAGSTVKQGLKELVGVVLEAGGTCLITADHGNADHMLEAAVPTAHSLNRVPVIVTVPGVMLGEGGILADVAPTLLGLMGIEQPARMSDSSLIEP